MHYVINLQCSGRIFFWKDNKSYGSRVILLEHVFELSIAQHQDNTTSCQPLR